MIDCEVQKVAFAMFSRLGGSIVAAKVEGSASSREKSFEKRHGFRKQWQQDAKVRRQKKKRVVGQSNKEVSAIGA